MNTIRDRVESNSDIPAFPDFLVMSNQRHSQRHNLTHNLHVFVLSHDQL